ncbi:MAG: nitrous oxide reductase family maturation protein NosD [Bacteriovorax sp.]|nr:nitrous oxide reductase family maturation protein NosD [Bacteriovorax sp.]
MVSIKNSFRAKIAIFSIIFIILITAQCFAATTFSVCDQNCNFHDLYNALDNPQLKDDDTIEVLSSQIITSTVVIKKSIHLIGKNHPVLDGKSKSKMLLIVAPNVEVAGLILKDSQISFLDDVSAIRIEGAAYAYIHDNKLINNAYGIYLAKSKNCRIENNEIIGVDRGDAESGNGIHIWSGKEHHIINNKLSKNRDGIYFEFVTDSKIEGNYSFQNSRYGLHFMFSHRNEYRRNRFTHNAAGVAVMYSKSILMDNNEFSASVGGGAYGLLLKEISLSNIVNNKFLDNSIGIYIEGTTKSHFKNNLFNKNARALRILGNSDGNNFERNFFLHNTFEVATNSSISQNVFDKNYWSKYTGYDLNGDGLGDVPHRPVSLSSILTETINSSFIFVHSPLFFLLDSLEKALPSFGPENLLDKAPLMIVPAEFL